jgi:hypothetical protein
VIALALAACGNDHAAPPADAPILDGLPCDVRAVLENACTQCHSSPVTSNAPESLVSLGDFLAPSSVAGQTIAERARARLHDPLMPMPPLSEPPLATAQLATLDAWLAAGAPGGACGTIPARFVEPTCASGVLWEGASSDLMQPGKPCRGCHETEAPQLAWFFMGTAFPAYHEGDDCEDPPPIDARVEIADADGHITLTLYPSADGDFTSSSVDARVPLPYTAKLYANGLVRAMVTPQMDGDCNSCHTDQGTSTIIDASPAPGRLVWPAPRP